MGFIDWIKGAANTVSNGAKWLGNKVGQGVSWAVKNVAQPVANFARNIPVVGGVVDAAQPILDLAGKAGDALQGKGSISYNDIKGAADALPGTILAGKTAGGALRNAASTYGRRLKLVS